MDLEHQDRLDAASMSPRIERAAAKSGRLSLSKNQETSCPWDRTRFADDVLVMQPTTHRKRFAPSSGEPSTPGRGVVEAVRGDAVTRPVPEGAGLPLRGPAPP